MSKNQDLFKSALADARALQQVALANAKKSLEEAFGPKVESMLSDKLAEMEDKEMEENMDPRNTDANDDITNMEEELEGILKELGMEDVNENDDLDEAEDEEKPAPKSTPKKKPSTPSALGNEDETPQEVVDLTVDELTDIIRGVVQDAISGGEDASGMDDIDGGMDDLGSEEDAFGGGDEDLDATSGEDELDLDELLAELDDVNENDDTKGGADLDENDDLDENSELDENEEMNEAEWYAKKKAIAAKKIKEATTTLDEAKQWYAAKEKGKKVKGGQKTQGGAKGFIKAPTGKTAKISETETNLNEAIHTIKVLKGTLKETNLLNSKLLYMNKLFKAKSLTEQQKVKVVSAFDKAKSAIEAKTIFDSLNETLTSKKSTIKESIMTGFASKIIGGTKKPNSALIVEDASVTRMKKLAGII